MAGPPLSSRVLRPSNGPPVTSGDRVYVWYSGELLNGTIFDANFNFTTFSRELNRTPFNFVLGAGQVIAGWDQELLGKRLGQVLEITIPSELAYGATGSPPRIGPDQPLRFTVELLAKVAPTASSFTLPTFEQIGIPVTNLNLESGAVEQSKIGLDGDDTLIGTPSRDLLAGLDGNDELDGRAGNDQMLGGNGNDGLAGEEGDDLLDGGNGVDTARFGAADNTVSLLIQGAQTTGEGRDTLIAIEHLDGGGGNDRLTGNGLGNSLSGGIGNDRLLGGGAQDRLSGGDGLDVHLYTRSSDSPAGPTRRDIITDFQGQGPAGDRIDLSAINLPAGGRGRAPARFRYINSRPLSTTPGEVRFAGGILQINTDADRAAEMEIALEGVTAFSRPMLII